MKNFTKNELSAALKENLEKKPLNKITINDITATCGVSRMTFHYHFQDIYDLVEWTCHHDAQEALKGKKTYDTWQEGTRAIFELVLKNKAFITNIYRSISREHIDAYLNKVTKQLFIDVVSELSKEKSIRREDQLFIVDFYTYAFVGILQKWIADNMKERPEIIIGKMAILIEGDVTDAISRFAAKEKQYFIS